MFEIRKNFYYNDEPWKNVRLGNSSETIGSWGSLLTSITMMLTGIGYPDETPVTVNEKMKKAGGFLKALPGPPYVAYVWPNCIYRGITRCENSNAPIAKIDAAVAAGKPVILQVDSSKRMGIQTHFVLVKDKKGDDYVLYDPFRDKGDSPEKEVLLTQRYRYNSPKLAATRAILEKEISAVLWFDFDKAELPERPDPKAMNFSVPAVKNTLYAAQERLVLRASPSVDSYPWKCLFKGTELTGMQAPGQEELSVKGWIPVRDLRGDQGYVSAAFVTSKLSDILPPTDAAQQPSRRKWCLKKVAVQQLVVEMRPYSDPENTTKYQGLKPDKSFEALPKYTVVSALKSDARMAGLTKILYQETYYNYQVKDWVIVRATGWVNEADLDDYLEDEQEEFRKSIRVDIPKETQTESSTDGQQDFYIDKEKKKARYNMCGELSVAFIAGKGIDEVLETWRNDPASRSTYDSMVGNADKPLETSHLENLLRLHQVDYEPYKYDRQGNPRKDYISLADKDGDRRLASQELETRLKDYYFITNLKIDTRTGDLEPAQSSEERNHWVVLDRVTRNHTRIELYNPFPNRLEEYSFGEFYRAVNGDPNSGWWIKKDVRLAALSQKSNGVSGASAAGAKKVAMPLRTEGEFRPPAFEVAIDNQTEYDKDAEQYLYIRGEGSRPKTNLCGEFCVSFILGQSLESSLKRWIETQGKQAGLWELAALLQAYGFNRRKYVKPLNATKREPGKYYVAPNNKLGLPSDSEQYFKSFSIDTVLEYWKGVQPDLFTSILGGNRNEKTGPDDLITIMKAYGYSREDFSYHRPGSQEDFGYAPSRDAEVVGKTHFVLAGVNISGTTGRLQPVGVAHWVVVTKVVPRGNLVGGNGGWVELYNPFPNCWEEYSYKEFMDSFAPGSTLWIKKDITPVFTRQRLASAKSKEKAASTNVNAGQKGDKKGQREQGKNKRKEARLPPIGDNPPLDVNRVVCERLNVEAIPWEIGEWISKTADGDEYFAGELAETLCECGILDLREIEAGENKKVKAAVLIDPEFSDKLEAAIRTSINRLSSSPRSRDPALKVASAVLPLFTRAVVQEIKEIRKNMPPQAYQGLPEFRAWTLGLASQGTDPLEEDVKKNLSP